jgi:hypothetical protein
MEPPKSLPVESATPCAAAPVCVAFTESDTMMIASGFLALKISSIIFGCR